MTARETGIPEPDEEPEGILDPDMAGALAALRRASDVARRRAIKTSGSVAIFRNGEIVWVTNPEEIIKEGAESG